ncbi:VOC family protein [Arthrobacter mobilis]|uniref:VOC family protein n=1 Tax=Arthrobacter mobilis TaxID=2724944 RepID=A0A7X6K3G5_9MICC|nr:VOC family protein [Arthrobacter mobilis]NKX54277.1 VOC family protein [Arthrobacter mobilis]
MPVRNEPWPVGAPCWIDCQVDDVQAARSFYTALFGWDVQDGPQEAGGYLMALLGGSPVAGIGPKPPNAGPMPSVWTTYLATEDADAAAAAVTDAGGSLMMPPFDVLDAGRMTVAMDNGGAAFGLWQAKAHHGVGRYGEPGTLVWSELHTREYQAARDFYAKVFGYSYEDLGDTDEFRYATFKRADGEAAGGFYDDRSIPAGAPNYWLAWFAVEDVDASVAKAQDLGAQALFPPTDSPYGRMSILAGAQGEVFAVIKPQMPDAGGAGG